VALSLTKLAERNPMFSFKWEFEGNLPFGGPTSDYVESVDLNATNVQIGGGIFSAASYFYMPMFSNVSSFSMTFFEDDEGTTLKWLTSWKSRIKNFDDGSYYLPANYKSEMKFNLCNTMGTPVVASRCSGVWPADTGALSLNYTDSGRITISQTFSCDDQTFE